MVLFSLNSVFKFVIVSFRIGSLHLIIHTLVVIFNKDYSVFVCVQARACTEGGAQRRNEF